MTLGKPHHVSKGRSKARYIVIASIFVLAFVLSFGFFTTTAQVSNDSYESSGNRFPGPNSSYEQKYSFLIYLARLFGIKLPIPDKPTNPQPTPVPDPVPVPNPTPTPTPQPNPMPVPPPTTQPGPIQISNKAEVGIDLAKINKEIVDVNNGVYDRPCTEAEHDPTKYHTLVNEEAKCHYDHQHNDDPNYVNDIFGEPGAWFGKPGQSISYPWQTFPAKSENESNDIYVKTNQMENDTKHQGYAWIVRRDQPCEKECVKDFRLEVHFDGNLHAATRFHSYSLEANFCGKGSDPSTCGIVRYGGWMDFGKLVTSGSDNDLDCGNGNRNFINVPDDNKFFPIDRPEARDEVRCHPFLTKLPTEVGNQALSQWWGHAAGETRIQLQAFNPIGNVDKSDPTKMLTFCKQTDPGCNFTGSILSVSMAYTENIPEFANGVRIDSDQNGRTDLKAYFTRFGDLNKSCTQAGLDCIPFEYNNVLLNLDYNKDGRFEEARFKQNLCEECQRVDYNIAPAGKQWITWFYNMAM